MKFKIMEIKKGRMRTGDGVEGDTLDEQVGKLLSQVLCVAMGAPLCLRKPLPFLKILNRISTLKGKRLAGSAEERGGESLWH